MVNIIEGSAASLVVSTQYSRDFGAWACKSVKSTAGYQTRKHTEVLLIRQTRFLQEFLVVKA
jgi:hypothetical protein